MFTYCTQVLHLAEHAAYNRIEVARAARRFPIILELLAEGRIHLSAARLLAPHLTEANHEELLREASHKSKRDVEQIVVRLQPRVAVPSTVRKLPTSPNSVAPDGAAAAATSGASPSQGLHRRRSSRSDRSFNHSPRNDTDCSSRLIGRRTTNLGKCKISSVTAFRLEIRLRYLIVHCHCCWRIWRKRSSRPVSL